MPNGNGTGPVGAGPITGRGAGKCAGNGTVGWQTALGSRGTQCGGRPRGSFRQHSQHAVASADAMVLQGKIDDLHRQILSLQQQLTDLGGKEHE